jgi:FAD/FMN-containing dehydrogenase
MPNFRGADCQLNLILANWRRSTSAGPVVSLVKMKRIDYDPLTQTIRVGPAVLWQDVVSYLVPYKRTVVGARLGNAGVSGMLLGGTSLSLATTVLIDSGGLSFLSPQYGWASTQVAAYEIVLANGTVVNATETQNTSLRHALQTGGNSFGLVTSFTLKTVPMTDVRSPARFGESH